MKRAIQAPLGAVGLEVRRTNPAPKPPRSPAATSTRRSPATSPRSSSASRSTASSTSGPTRARPAGGCGRPAGPARSSRSSPSPRRSSASRHAAEGDPAWIVHHLALGRVAATQRINLTTGTTFSSFLEPNATATRLWPQWTQTPADEEVEVARLDEVLASAIGGFMADRIFLKLDTQGYDLEVLAGAPASSTASSRSSRSCRSSRSTRARRPTSRRSPRSATRASPSPASTR